MSVQPSPLSNPPDNPQSPAELPDLGYSKLVLFHTGRVENIHEAIQSFTLALDLAPAGCEDVPIILDQLGDAYFSRSKCLDHLTDIEKAIECQSRAVTLVPNGSVGHALMISALGRSYIARFERCGDPNDIDGAIDSLTFGTSRIPRDDKILPGLFVHLAISHQMRFQRLGKPVDIDTTIQLYSQVLLMAPDDRRKLSWLANLAGALIMRFEKLGDTDDLERAIRNLEQTLTIMPSTEGETLATVLSNLGHAYQSRFSFSGTLSDVDRAIEHLNRGFASYLQRFRRLDNLDDIDKAIAYSQRGTLLVPNDYPNLPHLLKNLGSSYQFRFERLGELPDIEKAIASYIHAISLMPKDHAQLSSSLNALGVAYYRRYERAGRIEDIDTAIEHQLRGLPLAGAVYSEQPFWLNNIANSYRSRYHRLGNPEDINKSIDFHAQAIALIPVEHAEFSAWHSNLGLAYLSRFDRLQKPEDVSRAIECLTKAITKLPEGHRYLPGMLGNLAVCYQGRVKYLGMYDDIDKAIECYSRAVSNAPNGHAWLGRWISGLGYSHSLRFRHLKSVDSLKSSIELFSRAVSMTPDGHAELPNRLHGLGSAKLRRYEHLGDSQCLEDAIECFRKAANSQGEPRSRFQAARRWAELASSHGQPGYLQAYRVAMDLVPQLVWLGTTVSQRYIDVQIIGDLALEAAGVAIGEQEYSLALEWLEQGRSIVWSQTLQLRSPIDDLRLARTSQRKFIFSRRKQSPEHAAQNHRRLAKRYEDLLSQVRSLPGFEDFLRPKRAIEFVRVARTGPVVAVNVRKRRCDALVLIPGDSVIKHVSLPSLTFERTANARTSIRQALQKQGVRERGWQIKKSKTDLGYTGQDYWKSALCCLWKDMALPVLEFLGFTERPANPSSLLLVGQAATPGKTPLPGTKAELKLIKQQIPPSLRYTELVDSRATTISVSTALAHHDWVHLACHAHQNITRPTESGFFLHDNTLDLAQITQQSFRNKGLAFLSACQTAQGDENLPDESVHLAAGMLMAGYPSVIATMWSVAGADAPVVADIVYERLLHGREIHSEISKALHSAVRKLREKVGEMEFSRWAPFIHIGV
ncbi:hypothetical protein FRC11_009859 [Ceratobasidium sp. 423]|nr:hypothetical protein FRC11_009859 [Ceratobasidium sp. 423]